MIRFHYGILVDPKPSRADLLAAFEDAALNIYHKLYGADHPTPEETEAAKQIIADGCRISIHLLDRPPEV